MCCVSDPPVFACGSERSVTVRTYRRHTQPVPDSQRWTFRIADVAARSGLSESEVREAIKRGELPARRYRERVWMIDPQEARAWLERMCEPQKAA